jgi:hypothetical protein
MALSALLFLALGLAITCSAGQLQVACFGQVRITFIFSSISYP